MVQKLQMIETTKDGSKTLFSPKFQEHYHSISGAKLESEHVFINMGLNYIQKKEITIFELGFGTGLNAILTYIEAKRKNLKINYLAIEKYPVEIETALKLNYHLLSNNIQSSEFKKFHTIEWNKKYNFNEYFSLTKIKNNFLKYNFENKIDLFYFDAFSYNSQPELWSENIFTKIYKAMNFDGILTTYASKGIIKQNLKKAGFSIKRLKGAAGKWHMLRAKKE